MPNANQEPNPNRRQTRAANANAHPGRVVMEVLGGRRNQEELEKEKEAKRNRRDAREKKKTKERVAIESIADFEDNMALVDKNQETEFPRHQTEGRKSGLSLDTKCYTTTFSEYPEQATGPPKQKT